MSPTPPGMNPTLPGPGRRGSVVARLLIAVGLAAGALLVSAVPASAHAVVVSSQPADGERLTTAPTSVTLQFNEPVRADLGGLQVLDANGKRVDTGADHTSGNSLTTSLQSGLPDGTYVASYRVVSADSHPVKGAIVFAVGDASATSADVGALTSGGGADRTFDLIGDVSRFLAYAGALTAAGLAFFLAFVHDGGPDGRPLARIVRGGALIGALGALGATATQAALATGRGWQAVVDVDVIHQVLIESLDWANIVLLAGLALVLLSLEARGRGTRQGLAFYGGMATTLSFVFSGHSTAAEDRWIAVLSNAVHVTTAAVWIGGLVGLAVVLVVRTRPGRGAPPDDGPDDLDGGDTTGAVGGPMAPVAVGTALMVTETPIDTSTVEQLRGTAIIVARFSTVALVSVTALWLAGGTLAWVELGSLGALTGTTYGRLVLVKVAIVVVIAALAAYNRLKLVPAILADVDLATDLAHHGSGATTRDPAADEVIVPDDLASLDLTPTSPSGDLLIDLTDPTDLTVRPDPLDAPPTGTALDVITAQPDAWAFDGLRHLTRTVVLELLAIVVVLGVTSVLVTTTPGRNASGDVGVVNQTLPITTSTPGSTLNLVVAPAKAGTNALHLSYADPRGRPIAIAGPVRIELTLPSAGIGPISRDVLPAGTGHYILEDAAMSPAGLWTVTIITRTSEFDEQRTAFSVKIH